MTTATGTYPQTQPRLALAALAFGVFMANLDLFVVNLALPSIGSDLGGTDLDRLSWVLTAYAAVFAGFLVPMGRWADRVGRRRGYLTGLALFTAASVAAAAAPSVDVLVAARAVQALGAALILPASLSLLLAVVPPAGRAKAIGGWAAAGAAAAASGPVVGGLLVQLDWRWVFLINVPLGIAAMHLTAKCVPETKDDIAGPRPDVVGATALAGAAALLALVLVEGSEWGWASGRTAAAAAGIVVLCGAVAWRSRTHPSPVLEPELLRPPTFRAANAMSFLFYAVFAAMLLLLVIHFTAVWGFTPVQAGLAIAPGPAMVLIVARKIVPAIIRDRGPRAASIAGSLLFAAGYALWALSWRAQPMYVSAALPGLILTGLGVGLVMPSTIVAGTAALPAGRFATGSAVLSMSRQVGAVAGTAGLVALIGSNPSSSDLRTSAAVLSIASLAVLVPSYWLVLPSEKGNSNARDR